MTFNAGSHVWIPDEEFVVIPAKVETSFSPGSAGKVTRLDDGRTVKLAAKDTTNLTAMNDQSLETLEDMVNFKELDENSILHNLRERFKNDNIYTNIGRILTSVNPFKLLQIYNPEVMDEYMVKGSRNMPPHVYGVADDAFNAMVDNKQSQSCIVSGESGAGKTEATKVFLQYISEKSKRQSEGRSSVAAEGGFQMQQKILESNPLMEAFGNAKTVRNDNSSRFGKWIEVQFDRLNGNIVGGSIKSYLLEKTRIVNQSDNERNYHIFYQFCIASETEPELKKYNVTEASQYYYLNQSEDPCTVVESIDDKEEWNATLNAMEKIGITEAERHEVLNILNLVLTIGNTTFTGSEKSEVENNDVVARAAGLFGVTPEALGRAMIKVDRSNPADPNLVGDNDLSQACDARDAFAKHIYSLLFDWIIKKINVALGRVPDNASISNIGVLDIFGFEFFQNNSFEQLCINYCNERLQGHFNDHIFKLEQEQYAKEGIDVTKIEFVDNAHVITTIDSKSGILQIIANELKLKNTTDQKLLKKLKDVADGTKGDKQVISYPDNKEIGKNADLENVFRVNHYAGNVTYRIEQFLEKNRDAVPSLFQKLGESCQNKFIQTLFKEGETAKKQALGLRFSSQLKDLMADLKATQPHFVRCVKPNEEKTKDKFSAQMVLAQLRYAGLLEVCRIRQMGYPVRRTLDEFYTRYKYLTKTKSSSHTDLLQILKKEGFMTDKGYQVGTTKVFLKTDQADSLEEERGRCLGIWVTNMQRAVRGYLVRILSKQWKVIRKQLKEAVSSRDKELLKAALLNYGSLPYGGRHLAEYRGARDLINRIEDEERIQRLLADAKESRDLNQIIAALKAADEKELGQTKEANELRMLKELIERENEAKQALRDALNAKDEAKIKQGVAFAKSLNLGNIQLCKDAESYLKAVEKERTARKNLQEAINNKDVEQIKLYMNQMADIGKEQDPLVKEGESIVHETAKAAAAVEEKKRDLLFALQKAISERNLQMLNDLEAEVYELGIDNDIVKEAQTLRDLLTQEMDICAKLSAETIAANAKAQTRAGLLDTDLVDLKRLIEEAEDALQPDDFNLLSARNDLYRLEQHLDAQKQLLQIMEDYKKKRAELSKEKDNAARDKLYGSILTILREGVNLATESGVQTDLAMEITEKLNQIQVEQDEMKHAEKEAQREANKEKMKDATEDEQKLHDAQYMQAQFAVDVSPTHTKMMSEAADSNRYNISKYYRLRLDDDYVERIPSDLKSAAAKQKLLSQPKPILKSLCRLDQKDNDVALKINRAILQYCGDLNVNFTAASAHFVLVKGMEDPDLTDEIYLQLLKHINQNPKPNSADKAWLLLCMATKRFPPKSEFTPYLLNAFITKKNQPGLIGNYARLCLVQLDATIQVGPTWFRPKTEDIEEYRKRPPILATIHTLEGKEKHLPVTPDMRVSAVLEWIKEAEEIEEEGELPIWGIYISTEEEGQDENPKERLVRFYQHYNPGKIAHVDLFLDHWKGNTEELFQKLTLKYGPEPTVDEKVKKKGMLSLPITAAMSAVKFLGFTNQREQPPPPQTSWPLPWWSHLGDVYLKMSKQKKVPRFSFKRRIITRQEQPDKWLYLQAVDDIRQGYLPVKNPGLLKQLVTMSFVYQHGMEKLQSSLTNPNFKDLGFEKFVPESLVSTGSLNDFIDEAIDLIKTNSIPTAPGDIINEYIARCRELPTYGMNFFYAKHSASDKNYVIAVDVEGIHVLEEDRTDVKRNFPFDTIKKFGATGEYFWMTIDEKAETEKPGRLNFLQQNKGINVLLYTLQSYEMYDCVYDATHIGVEDEEGEEE